MKKCLTLFLALCLLFAALPGAQAMGGAYPTSGSCGPDASYDLQNGILTISGTGPVTWEPWHHTNPDHDWSSRIKSVVIEDGITELCAGAFYGSVNLTAADIPDSVTRIGRGAFVKTPWLDAQTDEFVIVGDGVLIAYKGPGGAVTIPDTVRSIAGNTFARSEITSITVGSSVEHIGELAFAYCPKLEQVSIADTVSHVEYDILRDAPWMEAQGEFVIVGNGVLIAYKGPGGVVTVPDTVRMIASDGLRCDDDGWIAEVTIPASVTEIMSGALEGGGFDGVTPPVVIHGALGSAAESYARSGSWTNSYRFVPFGQEDGSLFNFLQTAFDLKDFSDVTENKWYHDSVLAVYELGLMKGISDDWFNPGGDIKLSEAVTVAARVRDTYYYAQTDFSTDGKWYQPYVDYALEHKMLDKVPDDLDRPATRAEFAALLATALPEKELEAIHEELAFTDVAETHPNYAAIMTLSRAGVMQGRGEGIFDPDAPVQRCEAAAMLSRCVKPELRIGDKQALPSA